MLCWHNAVGFFSEVCHEITGNFLSVRTVIRFACFKIFVSSSLLTPGKISFSFSRTICYFSEPIGVPARSLINVVTEMETCCLKGSAEIKPNHSEAAAGHSLENASQALKSSQLCVRLNLDH